MTSGLLLLSNSSYEGTFYVYQASWCWNTLIAWFACVLNLTQIPCSVMLLPWNTSPFFAFILSTYIDKDFPNSYIQGCKQCYMLLENKKFSQILKFISTCISTKCLENNNKYNFIYYFNFHVGHSSVVGTWQG